MKTLKVFGGRYYGHDFDNPKGNRQVCGAYTKKQAMELMEISQSEMKNFFCETHNDIELATAVDVGVWVFDTYGKLLGKIK